MPGDAGTEVGAREHPCSERQRPPTNGWPRRSALRNSRPNRTSRRTMPERWRSLRASMLEASRALLSGGERPSNHARRATARHGPCDG